MLTYILAILLVTSICFCVILLYKNKRNKKEETAFQVSRDYLVKIINSIPDPIFVKDRGHRWLLLNDAHAQMFGIPSEDMLGKTDKDYFPREQAEMFWNKDEIVFQNGQENINEELWTDSKGFKHTILTKKNLYTDKKGNKFIVGIIRDITESKKIEVQLKDSRDYLNKIINSVADPIFVKDREHRWTLVNDVFCQFMGYPTEKIIGKTDGDYFPKEQTDVFWEKDEIVFQTGKENINEEKFTDARGATHTIITKKALYTDNEGKNFIVGIIRDITDLKIAQEKLQEAMEIRSRFTSVVSHELRTPLASIRTGVNLILDGLAGEINNEQKEFLGIVRKNIERLSRLINDILDFQKIDSGKMRFKIEKNNINEVVKEVHKIMLPLLERKGLELKLELDEKIDWLKFDRDRMIQVFSNLVNNAIDFTEKGTITVVTKIEKNCFHAMVIDTGVGIRQESLPKIFNPFEQAERVDSGKREGTGLGLAICKEIITRHNGKIWVESGDKGSTFHFTIPIEGQ